MTYSIVARDTESGDLGVAVQSHYFGVGSVVPWARAGVGAVATQSVVNATFGPLGLDGLADGRPPASVLQDLLAADPGASRRQVAMVDGAGSVACHTGNACIACAGDLQADGVSVQANLVESPRVWEAMLETFLGARGTLAERMIAALEAGEANGGDLRGRQAAGLVVVRGIATGDPAVDCVVDVRVDDSPEPLTELGRLLRAGAALHGLVAMLDTDGLFSGPVVPGRDVVEAALAELARAQELLGPSNPEPAVWRGLLLARLGRSDDAREAFVRATAVEPRVPQLVRALADAGMWSRDRSELESLLDGARALDPTS